MRIHWKKLQNILNGHGLLNKLEAIETIQSRRLEMAIFPSSPNFVFLPYYFVMWPVYFPESHSVVIQNASGKEEDPKVYLLLDMLLYLYTERGALEPETLDVFVSYFIVVTMEWPHVNESKCSVQPFSRWITARYVPWGLVWKLERQVFLEFTVMT